jgi:hypothetical protein
MSNFDFKARMLAVPHSSSKVQPGSPEDSASKEEKAKNALEKAQAWLNKKAGKWQQSAISSEDLPKSVIKTFDKAVKGLGKVMSILTKVMKILQLFISSFGSFSSLISSLLSFIRGTVNTMAQDLATAGAYMNILMPPSLNRNMFQNDNWKNLSAGGFEGFLGRLQVSLVNPYDKNRPIFDDNGVVGGFIILVDATAPDEFFKTLKQLGDLFDFMDLFPFNTSVPPPENIQSYPVYQEMVTEDIAGQTVEKKYGIRLKWDAPPGVPFAGGFFRVSRSTESGGRKTSVKDIPTKLGGKDGFLHALKVRLSTLVSGLRDKRKGITSKRDPGDWPLKPVYKYDDPTFNPDHKSTYTEYTEIDEEPISVTMGSPVIVKSNIITGGGEYVDQDIPVDTSGDPTHKEYHYIIESGWPAFWGPPSSDIMVPVEKKCIDPMSTAVVEHPRGYTEFISAGWGGLGSWSSLQIGRSIPLLPNLIDMMDKLLATLEGMVKNSSDSFTEFLNGLEEKIQKYMQIIDIMTAIVTKMKELILGPSAAFLYIPPQSGGVAGFMDRIRSAKQPKDGFSGVDGMTAGVVFAFGGSLFTVNGEENKALIEVQTKALEKAFGIMVKLLTGGGG